MDAVVAQLQPQSVQEIGIRNRNYKALSEKGPVTNFILLNWYQLSQNSNLKVQRVDRWHHTEEAGSAFSCP